MKCQLKLKVKVLSKVRLIDLDELLERISINYTPYKYAMTFAKKPSTAAYQAARDVLKEIKKEIEKSPVIEQRELDNSIKTVETNIFDKEKIIENCTVQILENSITGEVSVGWWRNE